MLIRYTTDFDCKEQTRFWYIVKDGPYDFNELGAKYKNNVNRSLKRTEVKQINPLNYIDELWVVEQAAYAHYKNADNAQTKEQFIEGLKKTSKTHEWWAAFSKKDGTIAGWMMCSNNGTWTETCRAKYHPERQGWNRPSDALHHAVLTHYLNELGQERIVSGTRNVNHKTHVQEYKENNWKFRKAYCHLHVIYNPKILWIIKLIYPFRRLLKLFDFITLVHQVNALMTLEEAASS